MGGLFKGPGSPEAFFRPGAEAVERRLFGNPEGHHGFGQDTRPDVTDIHDVFTAAEGHCTVMDEEGPLPGPTALAADRPVPTASQSGAV